MEWSCLLGDTVNSFLWFIQECQFKCNQLVQILRLFLLNKIVTNGFWLWKFCKRSSVCFLSWRLLIQSPNLYTVVMALWVKFLSHCSVTSQIVPGAPELWTFLKILQNKVCPLSNLNSSNPVISKLGYSVYGCNIWPYLITSHCVKEALELWAFVKILQKHVLFTVLLKHYNNHHSLTQCLWT